MTLSTTPTYADLEELVRSNPGQGELPEYTCMLDTLRARAPCQLLIFGVGRDSALWLRANRGGRTVFIEHEAEWIRETRARLPEAEVVQVRYRTYRWQWWLLLHQPWLLQMNDLPKEVMDARWDVIFVDSPQGGHATRPGRMKSLYTAAQLARRVPGTEVLVHDCDRRVEQVYSDRYLGPGSLVASVGRLRHYRF
jgi:hypothetical protein